MTSDSQMGITGICAQPNLYFWSPDVYFSTLENGLMAFGQRFHPRFQLKVSVLKTFSSFKNNTKLLLFCMHHGEEFKKTLRKLIKVFRRLPWWLSGKELPCQYRRHRRRGFDSWIRKIPWRRKWQPTPVFLPGDFHEQRSLDMT